MLNLSPNIRDINEAVRNRWTNKVNNLLCKENSPLSKNVRSAHDIQSVKRNLQFENVKLDTSTKLPREAYKQFINISSLNSLNNIRGQQNINVLVNKQWRGSFASQPATPQVL